MTRTLISNFAVELHSLRDFASNPKKKGDLSTSEFWQLEQLDHRFLKFNTSIFKKTDEEKKKLRKLKSELGIPLTKD